MSLIVEDGSGIPDAESYITVAACDTYHNKRGNLAWAALDDSSKEQCLFRATDYMEQAYRHRWKGYRTRIEQALCWPRQGVTVADVASQYLVANNVIPQEVMRACAEFALRAMNGPLAPDLRQAVLQESVAGAVSVSYHPNSPQHTRYRAIDMLLQAYLQQVGAMTPLGRA